MPEPISAVAFEGISKGVEILDKIGVLEKVKNKLVNNPDAAAAKLSLVLAALAKTYQIVDDTLVSFNAMSFENSTARHDAVELLNRARGGRLRVEMEEARAHCHKIWYIYETYLKGWFSRVRLDKEESDAIENLFVELAGQDGSWIDMLNSVAGALQKTSDEMLDHLENNRTEKAQQLQSQIRKRFREQQSRIGEGLERLQKLRRDFTTLTGGINL